MRHFTSGSSLRILAAAFPALILLFGAGCGDSAAPLFPVKGKITFDDEPFVRQSTTVLLSPVEAREDDTEKSVGKIDYEGSYEVYTGTRKGAPPGRYKVVVSAHDDAADLEKKRAKRPAPRSLLPAKYGSRETTDLEIEVVANPAPGAYDLALKK